MQSRLRHSSLGMVIGVPFGGIGAGGDWSTNLFGKDDLNTWIKSGSRDGLTLTDSISPEVNDVKILTPIFRPHTNSYSIVGDKTRIAEKVFDGNSYTMYFKCIQLDDTPTSLLASFGGYQSNLGFSYLFVGNTLLCRPCDGNGHALFLTPVSDVATILRNAGFVEFFIEIDAVNKLFKSKILNSDGDEIGTTINSSIASFDFTEADNYRAFEFANEMFAIGNFKKFLGLKTLAQCQDDSYTTDLQIWLPDMVTGTDVTGNGNHFTLTLETTDLDKYYCQNSSYLLDKGYSLYRSINNNRYIPYDIAGNPIVRTFTGYSNDIESIGNLTNHNLADSLLEFTGANWDRSDETIFSDSARGANTFYDIANPKRWHITELNRIVMNGFYNTNYKNTNFVKIINNSTDDRNILTELIGYNTDKSGEDLHKVLIYTNDYKAPIATFDNGLLIISFDDSAKSQYSVALPALTEKGIKHTNFVITGNVTSSGVTYLTWEQVWRMYCLGHDMQCHGGANMDTLTEEQIDAAMQASNALFIAHGIAPPNHLAYPGGAYNDNVKLWVADWRQTARKTGDVPSYTGFGSDVDKYALPSMSIDNISEETYAILLAKLDTLKENHKAGITYSHAISELGGVGETSISHLTGLIEKAQSIGMPIIVISELYPLLD